MSMPGNHQRQRRARWIGIHFPVLIGVALMAVLTLWYPQLPDPVATHWDGSGADGFTARIAFLFIAPVLVVLSSIPMAAIALLTPQWSQAHRVLISLAAGMAVLLGGIVLALAQSARGAGSEVAASAPSLLSPFLAGLIVWVGAWLLTPGATSEPAAPVPPEKAVGEVDVEWSTTVFAEGPILIFLGISMIPALVLTVWLLLADLADGLVLTVILGVCVLLLVGLLAFRIRITPAGFLARSIIGWPRISVPARTIATVEVEQIDPLGDFGGWGIRWMGRKRLGLVFHAGDGIVITQHSGRVVAVTLTEAHTAQAALSAAIERLSGRE